MKLYRNWMRVLFTILVFITLGFSVNITADTTDVLIDSINFPDQTFRNYVSTNWDTNKDNVLSLLECTSVKEFDYARGNAIIKDFKGIEFFTELTKFKTEYMLADKLDFSHNTKLVSVDCSNFSGLNYLNVSQCSQLTYLNCSQGNLVDLDISNCTSLTDLDCSLNLLTYLNISNCKALKNLYCQENVLTSLDASQCSQLLELDCSFNKLSSLNISKCVALKRIVCEDNKLTKLKVSICKGLEKLNCNKNKISSLDVSKCLGLTILNCADNKLKVLDVKACKILKELRCSYNALKVIDVTKATKLEILSCDWNYLATLKLVKNKNLKGLSCGGNQFTKLDLSKNKKLDMLYCTYSNLSTLNIKNNKKLERLDYSYNTKLKKVDVTKNTQLSNITIGAKKGSTIDVKKLLPYYTNGTQVTYLSGYSYLATVNSNGLVKVKNIGLAEIYISKVTASGTQNALVRIVVEPSKPTFSVIKKSKTSTQLTIKKVSNASGYLIYRSSSLYGKYEMIKKTKSTKYTDSNLKSKKTYYYKIRAYKFQEEDTIYSQFTKVMKISLK